MKIKTWLIGGTSVGLVIPVRIAELLGIQAGDILELTLDSKKRLVLEKVVQKKK